MKPPHPNHQIKLRTFFEASLHNKQKQVTLLQSEVKGGNKDLVLVSLKIAHIVVKRKRPYTELKSVFLTCLEIAADILHKGKKVVGKVRKIFLPYNTTKVRYDNISKDLLSYNLLLSSRRIPLMACNLIKQPIFQMRQITTYCQFADAEAKTTVEHYLCSVQVKVSAIAQFIFDKLNKFLEEHNFYLKKCKSVTIDGAAAMQGSTNEVV